MDAPLQTAALIHRCVNKQASKHSVINEELREWDQDKFGALYVLPQDSGTIPKGLIVASHNVWFQPGHHRILPSP